MINNKTGRLATTSIWTYNNRIDKTTKTTFEDLAY